MLPETTARVERRTKDSVNERIWRNTECNIKLYSKAGPEAIDMRLKQLDREWDIERAIEANAASFSLLGLALGTFVNKKWYLLSAAVGGLLLQHAIQGWCPPVPVLRRMGFRTMSEINHERGMLRSARDGSQAITSPSSGMAAIGGITSESADFESAAARTTA